MGVNGVNCLPLANGPESDSGCALDLVVLLINSILSFQSGKTVCGGQCEQKLNTS